ncbi:MAG: hypothetical protein LBF41_05380, partial [Deltaproteobacteria bacterium]|nr:hypothetical protein [Deltaproteobacteria bacterium]
VKTPADPLPRPEAKDRGLVPGDKPDFRVFSLSPDREIEIRGNEFRCSWDDSRGTGSLELTEKLSGHPKERRENAVRELLGKFSEKEVLAALTADALGSLEEDYESVIREPYELPDLSDELFRSACFPYLTETLGLNPELVLKLREEGLVLSDRRGGILFACEEKSGVFVLNTAGARIFPRRPPPEPKNPRTLHEFLLALGAMPWLSNLEFVQPGSDALPFVLKGDSDTLTIMKNPVKALLYKEAFPNDTVLTLGTKTDPSALEKHMAGKKLVITYPYRPAVKNRALARFLRVRFNLTDREVFRRFLTDHTAKTVPKNAPEATRGTGERLPRTATREKPDRKKAGRDGEAPFELHRYGAIPTGES